MSITRRPALDLPLMPRRRSLRPTVRPGAEFEPVSPLDVPAFLRRQSEASNPRDGAWFAAYFFPKGSVSVHGSSWASEK